MAWVLLFDVICLVNDGSFFAREGFFTHIDNLSAWWWLIDALIKCWLSQRRSQRPWLGASFSLQYLKNFVRVLLSFVEISLIHIPNKSFVVQLKFFNQFAEIYDLCFKNFVLVLNFTSFVVSSLNLRLTLAYLQVLLMDLSMEISHYLIQLIGLAFEWLNLVLVTVNSFCHVRVLLFKFPLSFGWVTALIGQTFLLVVQLLQLRFHVLNLVNKLLVVTRGLNKFWVRSVVLLLLNNQVFNLYVELVRQVLDVFGGDFQCLAKALVLITDSFDASVVINLVSLILLNQLIVLCIQPNDLILEISDLMSVFLLQPGVLFLQFSLCVWNRLIGQVVAFKLALRSYLRLVDYSLFLTFVNLSFSCSFRMLSTVRPLVAMLGTERVDVVLFEASRG